MPRSGVGTSFSSGETLTDLSAVTPRQVDTWEALFRDASFNTAGRSLIEWGALQSGQGGGGKLTIDEANQKYNLNLKPSFAKTVSDDMAQWLQRKNIQRTIDQSTIQAGSPSIVDSLGAGLAASVTDPLEFALTVTNPVGKLAKFGLGAAAATKIPAAVRFSQQAARVVSNPWLAGAIDNGGFSAITAPVHLEVSGALGREYDAADALSEIALNGVTGSLLHGAGSMLFRGRRSTSGLDMTPLSREAAFSKASSDFANGDAISVEKAVNTGERLPAVQEARQRVVSEILADSERIYPVVDESVPLSPLEEPVTQRSLTEPIPDEVLHSPEVQQHTTPIEQKLMSVADPEFQRLVVQEHVTALTNKISRLSQMFDLPKGEFLEVDAVTLQNEVLYDIEALNELVPDSVRETLQLSKAGLVRKSSLKVIGKALGELNDKVSLPVDDAARIAAITPEFDRLRAELKHVLKAEADARTKGIPTEKWETKIQELTPQVQHVQTLLRALGETAEAPELTFDTYLQSLGDVGQGIKKLLAESPDLADQPTYRVRRGIFNNIMRRLDETEQFLKESEDVGTTSLSKFPEDIEILRDVQRELAELGDTVETDKFHEKLFERVNKELQEQKALGIFTEEQLARFDKIEEQFKGNVEKTEAVKKGAVQAQVCALGGVTEET